MLIWRGNLLHLPDITECIVEIVRSAVSYRKKKGVKNNLSFTFCFDFQFWIKADVVIKMKIWLTKLEIKSA